MADFFRIARQMKRVRQDVVGGWYGKDSREEIEVQQMEVMDRWREYFRDLLNKQNEYQLKKQQEWRDHWKRSWQRKWRWTGKGWRAGRQQHWQELQVIMKGSRNESHERVDEHHEQKATWRGGTRRFLWIWTAFCVGARSCYHKDSRRNIRKIGNWWVYIKVLERA